ncbi:hypothetical protein QIW31_06035 [Francisellaceae bacterium CB299]
MRKSNKKNISSDAWISKKTIAIIVLAISAITPMREIKLSLNVVINGSINTPSSSH